MKLLKRAASLLLAAVISVGTAAAVYAESPAGSGTPTGADLLITDGNVPQSTPQTEPGSITADQTTPDQPPAEPIPDIKPEPKPGDSDKVFQPVNYREWTWWDGESEFNENTDYYIEETMGLRGEFTLPASSRLLIAEDVKFYIFSADKFTVYGSLIVAPGAEMLGSGVFSLMESGTFENYGSAKFTKSSVVNISSDLVTYGGSETAFGGETFVYGSGKFTNYGTAYVTRFSETTVTGTWRTMESGLFYIAGSLTTTLSGTFYTAGYTSLQDHTRITNSGTYIIDTTVKYYVDENARVTNTRSGRIIDYRDPEQKISAEEFKSGIKGIDVSVWQGVIDWKQVKEAGVRFAIIRSSSGPRVDKLFDYNIVEAQKAGILVGVYHYCYAMNPEEAREEARHFIETIKPYRIDYPVMFDFEDNSQAKLGKETLTAIAEAFLSELKNAGYYPMIYSYRNWLENNLDMDRLSEYDVALAEWNVTTPKYTRPYGIWQYSCKGRISGIEGDVDLDLCYRDYAKLIREGGYNNLS
ncbi:MAG: glycoside hydrolase family 25 protein [Oscillospiraceae bacterium]|nr:glycoside hydrolase family 25 protein [Oscillospiraceae bacterium]